MSYDERATVNPLQEVLRTASQPASLCLGENYRTASGRDYAWWQDMAICGPIPPKQKLTQWGASRIIDAVSQNTALTHLDFRLHNICPRGATHLADGLRVWTSLHALDLTGNDIHNEGIAALAVAFPRSLQTVLIRDNHITEEGLISFTSRLASLTVHLLDLSSN